MPSSFLEMCFTLTRQKARSDRQKAASSSSPEGAEDPVGTPTTPEVIREREPLGISAVCSTDARKTGGEMERRELFKSFERDLAPISHVGA